MDRINRQMFLFLFLQKIQDFKTTQKRTNSLKNKIKNIFYNKFYNKKNMTLTKLIRL